MGKLRSEDKSNVNKYLCDMLLELALYEKNVTKNVYKYNAYRVAARNLANYPTKITSGKEAKKIKGIGEKIANKIDQFLESGKLQKLEKIRKDKKYVAILLFTRVSGIGPSKAIELVEKGARTIQDLENFKDQLTHHQLIGLKYFYDFEEKIPRSEISKIEKIIVKEVCQIDSDCIVTICGSYRRGKESSGDIDCLITHPSYTSAESKKSKLIHEKMLKQVVKKLTDIGLVTDTIALGHTKFMGVCRLKNTKPARRLDIRLTPHDQYFCSILYFTGSDLFNKNMRAHALQQGFTLNEYSLRPIGETGVLGKPVPITCEQDIFDYINYPYKAPEEREV